MDERIKTIWLNYGQTNQLGKVIEELDELKVEIEKYLHFIKSTDNKSTALVHSEDEFLKDKIAEEAADVTIMIDQLIYGFNIGARVEAWREYKIDRQLKRMEAEQ